ncbi:6-carboxytetrahydropterin synthase [Methanobrevibacter sp. OttesenSCG-928-K11]|nr:6-carboxytetrahydropterin synthase [Methanobrevibacter sp. OttesenSCG-928-K11]MDL2271349.1 6-carboxytetrahydropterin synthase [Methanobrevibacter sp. OttesenSCG-928-I08]
MKIIVNGINANLRFSSAHLIPGHDSCGYIHGHSYFVDIEIEGERKGDFNFVVDFKDVKQYVRAICNHLDHKLLIPIYNDLISFKEFDDSEVSIEKLENMKSVAFKVNGKGYTIPSEDCVFLPLKYSSAEELSQFFAEKLVESLEEKYDNLDSVSACVNEGIGQGALFKKIIRE